MYTDGPSMRISWLVLDTTTVPYGVIYFDMGQQADDRLRYCAKRWDFSSIFHDPDWLRPLKFFDNEHTRFLILHVFQ